MPVAEGVGCSLLPEVVGAGSAGAIDVTVHDGAVEAVVFDRPRVVAVAVGVVSTRRLRYWEFNRPTMDPLPDAALDATGSDIRRST